MPVQPLITQNGRAAADADMAARALETLKHLGIAAEVKTGRPGGDGGRLDLIAAVGRGKHRRIYALEVKRGLRPITLGPLILRLRQTGRGALLITEHVTPAMAEILREAKVAFVDL